MNPKLVWMALGLCCCCALVRCGELWFVCKDATGAGDCQSKADVHSRSGLVSSVNCLICLVTWGFFIYALFAPPSRY